MSLKGLLQTGLKGVGERGGCSDLGFPQFPSSRGVGYPKPSYSRSLPLSLEIAPPESIDGISTPLPDLV